MIAKVSLICFLAVAVYARPEPEADPQFLAAAPLATPVVHAAPATVKHTYQTHVATPPECAVEEEELEVQNCAPRAENVCTTQDVVSQHITYEKKCKPVTSRHCPHIAPVVGHAGLVLKKREAEADPQLLLAAPHAPVVTVKHEVPECTEVTTEHCVDVPVPVEKSTPVETCHIVTKVDCTPIVHKIPKVVCNPGKVETKEHEVEVPVAAPFYYGK